MVTYSRLGSECGQVYVGALKVSGGGTQLIKVV